MVVYSIKDLEKLSGVKAHTLRIWEKRYNILNPKRTPTNIRYYLDDDLKLILNIALLNRHGIKISKIARMKKDQIQKKVAELTDVDESFEGQLDSLTISLIELDEEKFGRLLTRSIEQQGFEFTMMEVIYPLLDKLAMMWVTGSIKSIHEKFVSELIKRKCISQIDGLKVRHQETVLIYLPTGETNELSLLFLHYLIKKAGYKVINAGADIQLDELAEVHDICHVDYVCTIINEARSNPDINEYLNRLCAAFPDSRILLSGMQALNREIRDQDQVTLLGSYMETKAFLESSSVTAGDS